MKLTLPAGLLLCAVTAFADQIVLRNGDRITGSIVKKDGAVLTIKSDLFGVISTPWEKVESIDSAAPVYVTSREGTIVEGPLTVSAGVAAIVAPGGRRDIAVADVAAIRNPDEQRTFERLESPDWGHLWAGNGTIGWAGSLGNARTLTFTTGLTATRATKNDKTSVYFNSIKATGPANGVIQATAQAVRGGIAYNSNVSSRIFLNTFNDYEYDRFQNLDLRFVAGAGSGLHAVATPRTRLDILVGGDYNRSAFTTFVRNSAEAYYGDDYQFKWNGSTTVFQTSRVFHDLTRPGQFRVNFDTGASVKIMKWLNWNLSVSDRYLNTPAPGRKSNDILYTTGFGISFAR